MDSLQDKYLIANKKLNNDLNYIVQAFINFYGEKYSDYIVNVLNDLKIIWYDDTKEKDDKDIKEHIVSSLKEEQIDEYLKNHKRECFLQSAYIDELDVLVLPLSYNITHIIHELNHKISSHILSIEPLKMISGICISTEGKGGVEEESSDLNEVINQKMTLEILDELKKLGLEINYTPSWQENMFPLINMFYETFKESLKNVYITGNIPSFINLIGYENYEDFSQRIFMNGFRLRRKLLKGETPLLMKDDIIKVEDIVKSMQEFNSELNITENRRKM